MRTSSRAFFRVGDLTLALRGPDRLVDPARSGPLGLFEVAGGPADARIRLEDLEGEVSEDGPLLFDSGAVWKLYGRADGFRLACSSSVHGEAPYRIADFSADWSRGVVATVPLDPAPSPLEHPLHEILVNALLARRGGVEIHGCGIVDGQGRGVLLAGSSGAGKTTSARFWLEEPGVEIVSDDRVIVRDEGNGFRLHGTPWHGEAELASPVSAPLAAIFLLEQAPANEIVALAPSAAVSRLVGCAFPPFYDPAAVASTLEVLAKIIDAVPVRLFRFTKDASSAAFIRETLAASPGTFRRPLGGVIHHGQHESPLRPPD